MSSDELKQLEELLANDRKIIEENYKEIERLNEQLEYLRSGEYLNQVKWERDFNEKVVQDLENRIERLNDKIEILNNCIEQTQKIFFIKLDSGQERVYIQEVLETIKELKGSDKE